MTGKENDNIEKALAEALAGDNKKEEDQERLDQKRTELSIFIHKRSEGLLPDNKKLIELYVPVVQEIQKMINHGLGIDQNVLIEANQNLKEITGQIGVKLQYFFEKEKYEPFQARFIHIFEEIKSFQQKAEEWTKAGKSLNEHHAVTVRGKFLELRDLLNEMFKASLTESDKQIYGEMPREILTEIRELEQKFQKKE